MKWNDQAEVVKLVALGNAWHSAVGSCADFGSSTDILHLVVSGFNSEIGSAKGASRSMPFRTSH
ncbi:hypothetical protein PUN4_650022 [Paraburkholderia unamae]|nr:hypothetical protein PUN4_650022 [Paraburkholderia unamae]